MPQLPIIRVSDIKKKAYQILSQVTIISKKPFCRFIEQLVYLVNDIDQIHQLFIELKKSFFAYNSDWTDIIAILHLA